MRKIIFSVVLLLGTLSFANAQTIETVEASKWSLGLKGGGTYFRVNPYSAAFDNVDWGAGLIIERTANPLFGMGLDVSYLNYAPQVNGLTIDPTLFASVNLSNLLFPYREAKKTNVFVKVGTGLSIYNNDTREANKVGMGYTPVVAGSINPEVNLSNRVALGAEIGVRYYMTEELGGLSSKDRFDDAMTAMLSLRFNLGGKAHARTLTSSEFYRMSIPAPLVNDFDDSNINNRLDNIDRQIQDIQNRLNQLEKDVQALKDMPKGSSFTATFNNVDFQFDSATLTTGAKLALDQVASVLLNNPTWSSIEIKGHTDNIGPDAYNQKLSERRANAVKDYLVSKGLNASALTTSGYGKTQPIATNNTAEGRKANRRVEFVVAN